MNEPKDDLKERVESFMALELPGQPQSMHIGSLNLVSDLWREVCRLRQERSPLLGS